ncbi:hypothetical protein N1031_10690 [Herbiconiux moechotypicola]|uniref:DUF4175 domain-containing protein n=1 Tax=Herbiconiux moechotypicola TaxID=637393 RepID=A0ABN3DM59_9MICO|nr:hypothetical protein [Herbiconiux moechotypicola]MCS5730227.1 hypothetical protein [Herbiconiux moechotypicola]
MIAAAVLVFVIGLVLLFVGFFVEAAKFLLWIGIVIVVVAIILALLRFIRRNV